MKVLIIEDETLAALKLIKSIETANPNVEILATLESVSEAVDWLQNKPQPDLLFMDIQLGDGVSFEIFEEINLSLPIVFVTAFDQYLLKAFKLHAIDYILKPFNVNQVKEALSKYTSIKKNFSGPEMSHLISELKNHFQKNYKSRFFVKQNNALHSVPIEEINYFESSEGIVTLVNNVNRRFVVDYSLEDLENCLDPNQFFRATRQLLIHFTAIQKMSAFGQGRIQVQLKNSTLKPFLISRARTKDFREWLDR